ncbi:5-methyltetrahydropteroyltriglutamate--homocysteine methyltransferase [Amycolatopsis endophytica]|uniref:5-methyltetrahydropteroyltriglutamate--homocysteine methyltransferase n=1 Tax=Amycolatopsis endophytica TaxID=860233 RepID=A0A853B3Q2_9PSEU|nr:cobalamin-independent methionine synthase II family protein [Amycolatopsis endophytica]NYI89640.1 5-methyltetrahydropteroyltriglutamate--homocysteine methyltransferase [Amycolatopsis endophytica]
MTTFPRATHVGSLLRPPRLLKARADHAANRLRADELHRIEQESILLALQAQRDSGIGVYTDGEYLRTDFMSRLTEHVDGFAEQAPSLEWRSGDHHGEDDSILRLVGGKLTYHERFTDREAAVLAAHAPGPFKISLPEVTNFVVANWDAQVSGPHYPSRADIVEDLADVLLQEAAALAEDGVRHVQIDAPCFIAFANPRILALLESEGIDARALLRRCIDADAAVVRLLRDRGVGVGMHICRGNYRGQWFNEGFYDEIAAEVFGGIEVDHWLLEYDTERAGTFEPLHHVPDGTGVVLGLITTKTGELEDPDGLARRVAEAARIVPLENLAISPQCGFASEVKGNPLTWDDQRRKLDLTVFVAGRVWPGG